MNVRSKSGREKTFQSIVPSNASTNAWWTRWVADVSGGGRVGWRMCRVVDALGGGCIGCRTRCVADVSGGGRVGLRMAVCLRSHHRNHDSPRTKITIRLERNPKIP